jgi:hypothetical protein
MTNGGSVLQGSSLKRLALEGLVIVGSVLLAFGIDAGWDAAKERDQFDSLMQLLRVDIDRNLESLEASGAFLDRSVPRLQTLLEVMGGSAARPESDSLRILVQSTLSATAFTPITAAYDAASGSSGWARLPAETQVAIARFVSQSESSAGISFVLDQFPRLVEVFGRHGGFQAFASDEVLRSMGLERPAGPADFEALLADQDFENEVIMYLVGQTAQQATYAAWVDEVKRIQAALAVF